MKVHHVGEAGRVSALNWSQQRMIDYIGTQLMERGRAVTPGDAATALGWPLYKSQKIMAELEELGLVKQHTESTPN